MTAAPGIAKSQGWGWLGGAAVTVGVGGGCGGGGGGSLERPRRGGGGSQRNWKRGTKAAGDSDNRCEGGSEVQRQPLRGWR